MKHSRRTKIEGQLTATESELLSVLSAELPRTAITGDLLFFNSRFCPSYVPPHMLGSQNEVLVQLAIEAVQLRESLGLPVAGSPGQLYLAACGEAANTADGNRRGPRQLASAPIAELRSNDSFNTAPDGAPQSKRRTP